MDNLKILRLPDALARLGISETTYRTGMANGLFPKLVSLGPRAVGIAEHDINQIARARIAGLPDDELRKIVNKIHTERARLAAELTGAA